MGRRIYLYIGLVGAYFPWLTIGISILYSPWFSWEKNALSDLGHAVKSDVAPIFNLGLVLGGLFIVLYSVNSLIFRARLSSLLLAVAGFNLQLVGVFDEVYGVLHFIVSVVFFLSMLLSSIIYALEKTSRLALASFTIGTLTWITYWSKLYHSGIAVPETISSLACIAWLTEDIYRSLKAVNPDTTY